jgi:hypothetical protein
MFVPTPAAFGTAFQNLQATFSKAHEVVADL